MYHKKRIDNKQIILSLKLKKNSTTIKFQTKNKGRKLVGNIGTTDRPVRLRLEVEKENCFEVK